jgi:hypothetical protein
MQLNRAAPALPVTAVQTYRIVRPRGNRLMWNRDVPCARADCQAYEHGWITRVDEATELGKRQAHYIRHEARRSHTEALEGGLTVFTFSAGQECFAGKHDVATEADPLFIVRDGDWRGNPSGRRRTHRNGVEWVEDFGEHQQNLADRIAQG